jgi:hypothetical protein
MEVEFAGNTYRTQGELDEFLSELKSVQYKNDREYPGIADQLDMLYWDKKNGTTIWEDTITEVKDANPKPI